MYAGQLRTRILIQRRDSGEDAWGQPVDTWADVGRDWADFRTISGLESIRADAATSITKASARIRFRTDVDTAMRVVVDGVTWEIKAVLPDVNTRKYVDLSLELVN